jgi:hypothetical protein
MTKNIGPEDRVVRIVVGIVLAVLIYMKVIDGTAAIVSGILAAYLVLTGLLRSCLIYNMLGVDTSVQEQAYTKPDERIDF